MDANNFDSFVFLSTLRYPKQINFIIQVGKILTNKSYNNLSIDCKCNILKSLIEAKTFEEIKLIFNTANKINKYKLNCDYISFIDYDKLILLKNE